MFCKVVQNDVRESFFFIAGEQATKNRIAGEARKTPPNQPRTRIDERGSSSVSDDGKVEAMIRHMVGAVSHCMSKRRYCDEATVEVARNIALSQFRTSEGE